jgi:hypothetical protein
MGLHAFHMKTNGGYSFSDIGHLFALKDRKLDTVDYGCIPIGVEGFQEYMALCFVRF